MIIIEGDENMSDIVKILKEEKERLTTSFLESYDRLKIIEEELGKKEYLSSDSNFFTYKIDYENLSPSQNFQYDYWDSYTTDKNVKLSVFESFIKEFVDSEIIKENEKGFVEPPQEYLKDVIVHCSDVGFDPQNQNNKIYSIKVGPVDVRCPKQKMSFDEYKKIYTESLYKLLYNELNSDFDNKEEINQNIKDACTKTYIDSISPRRNL